MTTMTMRPDADEYDPYYQKYIDRVADGDIAAILGSQVENTLSFLRTASEENAGRAYAAGKWTIKQVLGHLIDAERIFAYRALCIARNDKTWLPGFEQDDYVANANFNARPLESFIDELAAVRGATVNLFKHFTDEEWPRRGIANQKEISARAIAYIAAGHELHHLEILKSRYLFR
jgi:hypothetical protein